MTRLNGYLTDIKRFYPLNGYPLVHVFLCEVTILLPGKNLGEIRGRIPARVWLPGISFPGENLARKNNPGGQNLAGIPTGFLPRSRRDPAKIPVLILLFYYLLFLLFLILQLSF